MTLQAFVLPMLGITMAVEGAPSIKAPFTMRALVRMHGVSVCLHSWKTVKGMVAIKTVKYFMAGECLCFFHKADSTFLQALPSIQVGWIRWRTNTCNSKIHSLSALLQKSDNRSQKINNQPFQRKSHHHWRWTNTAKYQILNTSN